jgi:outer membrane protein assembly factor BamB
MQSLKIINQTKFADYQSSSYLFDSPKVSGKIKWKYKTETNEVPDHMSLAENMLIIGTQNSVQALDCAQGCIYWNEPIYKNFIHTSTEYGALIDSYFKLRKYKNKEYNQKMINTTFTCYINFFKKSGIQVLYSFQALFDRPERGEPPYKPLFRILRYDNEETEVPSAYIFVNDKINSVMLTKDDTKMILLSKNKSYVIHPLGDMQSENVVPVSHDIIQCGSLSESGDLLLVEKRDNGNYLKCTSLDGAKKWETELPDSTLCDQPPACTPAGNILYMTGNFLVSINKGRIKWLKDIAYIPEHSFLTAFGENSAIVVTGTQLVIIDDLGNIKMEMQLPFNATCRPIIGNDGAVYAGGSDGVCCIK